MVKEMQRRQRLAHKLLTSPRTRPETGQCRRACVECSLSCGRKPDAALAAVEQEILVSPQLTSEFQRRLVNVLLRHLPTRSGNDQGDPRFVDQHTVGLIDDTKAKAPQH